MNLFGPDSFDETLAPLLSLERDTATLEQHAGLAPLPAERPDDSFKRHPSLRVRAVRARLHELGYLAGGGDEGRGPRGIDPELEDAIARFQGEAGLTVDGWVGEETWGALQALVAIEPELELARWLDPAGAPRPALVRAVQLRLKLLGLYNGFVSAAWADSAKELDLFKQVAGRLGLCDRAPEQTSSTEAITALFAHDEAVHRLAQAAPKLESVLPLLLRPGPDTLDQHFLFHWVRAELWLLGYTVGDLLAPVRTASLRKVLAELWTDFPQLAPADAPTDRIGPALFQAFERLRVEPERDIGAEVALFVRRNEGALQERWTTELLEPVFFIWDGFQRSVRWLARKLEGLAQATVSTLGSTAIGHLLRILFRAGSRVFTVIRQATTALVQTTDEYLEGRLRTGPRATAFGRLSLDGDLVLFLGSSTGEAERAQLLTRVALLPEALGTAGLILGCVARALVDFATARAWLGVLTTLLEAGPELVKRARELAATEAKLEQLAPNP